MKLKRASSRVQAAAAYSLAANRRRHSVARTSWTAWITWMEWPDSRLGSGEALLIAGRLAASSAMTGNLGCRQSRGGVNVWKSTSNSAACLHMFSNLELVRNRQPSRLLHCTILVFRSRPRFRFRLRDQTDANLFGPYTVFPVPSRRQGFRVLSSPFDGRWCTATVVRR